jgi:hypothetical protein
MPESAAARWTPAVTWFVVGAAGWITLASAARGADDAARVVISIMAGAAWLALAVAAMVPSSVSLTLLRWTAVLVPIIGVAAMIAGAEPGWAGALIAVGVVHVSVVASAAVGRAYAQASAYGDEQRFPLRLPATFIVPLAGLWLAWGTTVLGAVLLLAHGRWGYGAPAALIAVAVTAVVLPRAHRLVTRWLVVVPAGLVVHDPVVLAETLMVTSANLQSIGLALAGTEAADLTGPSGGHALEVTVRDMVTALLPPTRQQPTGRALHVQAFLVAPSRPGAALAAATRPR